MVEPMARSSRPVQKNHDIFDDFLSHITYLTFVLVLFACILCTRFCSLMDFLFFIFNLDCMFVDGVQLDGGAEYL